MKNDDDFNVGTKKKACNNFDRMFLDCYPLTSLNVENFILKIGTYKILLFENCYSLKEIKFINFNTSKVGYMYSMFNVYSNLISLYLSSFDNSSLIIASRMFYDISELLSINQNLITENLKYADGTFSVSQIKVFGFK